jgi:hypothetical protein
MQKPNFYDFNLTNSEIQVVGKPGKEITFKLTKFKDVYHTDLEGYRVATTEK